MDIIKVDSKKCRLISDGGCRFLEPDNTYSSFLASCNRMYYGIKCDIRFTKDRVIVTSRYRDLSKMEKGKLHISLTNYNDLKDLKFGHDQLSCLITLKTFLSLCHRYNKIACIEIHPPIGHLELKQLLDEIVTEKMINRCKIISTDIKYLKYIRQHFLDIMLELRCNNFSDQLFLDAIKYHFDLTLPMKKLSHDLVDMCHDNRINIGTFNVNDPVGALILCELKVDYIYTYLLEEYKPN